MLALTTPDPISGPFASGANALKNAIPNSSTGSYLASMEDGFPATTMQPTSLGGTPPDGKDLNGILNKVSQHYFQFQNGYLPTFVQETSNLIGGYPKGAILWYSPASETKAIPLISLVSNNTYNFNTTPAYIDGEHWDYAITGNYVTTYTDQTVGGNKNFTGTITAPTPSSATDNSTKVATTAHIINVLKAIYPVGATFIGTTPTCPMSVFFGTWELVAIGRALWGGDGTNANTTIAAGLPNITGGFSNWGKHPSSYGVFQHTTDDKGNRDSYTGNPRGNFTFNAARSSSVFGVSDTVQPPAYVVNVWRRIA